MTSMGISQWTHFGSGFAAVTLQEDDMQVRRCLARETLYLRE